jgi:hypothetical protein
VGRNCNTVSPRGDRTHWVQPGPDWGSITHCFPRAPPGSTCASSMTRAGATWDEYSWNIPTRSGTDFCRPDQARSADTGCTAPIGRTPAIASIQTSYWSISAVGEAGALNRYRFDVLGRALVEAEGKAGSIRGPIKLLTKILKYIRGGASTKLRRMRAQLERLTLVRNRVRQ